MWLFGDLGQNISVEYWGWKVNCGGYGEKRRKDMIIKHCTAAVC